MTDVKDLVFISHANPEDNASAAWFATRLSLLGYRVWCDIKNTHGGESDFWFKVQNAVENEAAKFVFLLSDASCDFERKKGIYKELQAASNLRRDNFIVPVRVKKLTRSVPILVGTDLYINGEDWAEGLGELVKRLSNDGVPREPSARIDEAAHWWPTLQVERLVRLDEPQDLVSNICEFELLPPNVHFLSVYAEGNLLAGRDRLKGVLASAVAWSAYGNYAISFGNAADFSEAQIGFDISDAHVVDTESFLASGFPEIGLTCDTARNICTYLIAEALEAHLSKLGLKAKTSTFTRRKLWYPTDALLPNNRVTIGEEGRRKVGIQLVGRFSHFKKKYVWHFGIQPTIDVRNLRAVVFSPRSIVSAPYKGAEGENPVPLDDQKAFKALGWWNKEWRQKYLAMLALISKGGDRIVISAGYQTITLYAKPKVFRASMSYREESDDLIMREAMQGLA